MKMTNLSFVCSSLLTYILYTNKNFQIFLVKITFVFMRIDINKRQSSKHFIKTMFTNGYFYYLFKAESQIILRTQKVFL